jgi:hypothetical protein
MDSLRSVEEAEVMSDLIVTRGCDQPWRTNEI